MSRLTASRIDIDSVERETGLGWGWFLALGIALVTLAALALLSLPSRATASLYAVGMVASIGALAQLGTPLLAPRWTGFSLLVLSAVFYGAAGILLMANPTLVARALTIMVAVALILSGVMRISLSIVMPYLPGRGWIGASGLVSVGAGLVFIGWSPVDQIWANGIVIAVDLAFQGAMAIGFGVTIKAVAK